MKSKRQKMTSLICGLAFRRRWLLMQLMTVVVPETALQMVMIYHPGLQRRNESPTSPMRCVGPNALLMKTVYVKKKMNIGSKKHCVYVKFVAKRMAVVMVHQVMMMNTTTTISVWPWTFVINIAKRTIRTISGC